MKKNTDETTKSVPVYSKEQIVESKMFGKYKDFLNGNLETGQDYSISDVEDLIKTHYKKGIGE